MKVTGIMLNKIYMEFTGVILQFGYKIHFWIANPDPDPWFQVLTIVVIQTTGWFYIVNASVINQWE